MEQKKVESDDEFVERHLDKVKGRISELAEERKQYTEEYCDQCDGCGWYEGGPTIKTTCEHCGGTGKILKKKVESLDVPKESHEQYTAKLLPCPLCDGKAGETVFSTGYINPGNYGVKCVACSLEIHSDRIDKVIGVWNTRNELADLRALHVKYKDAVWVLNEELTKECKASKDLRAKLDEEFNNHQAEQDKLRDQLVNEYKVADALRAELEQATLNLKGSKAGYGHLSKDHDELIAKYKELKAERDKLKERVNELEFDLRTQWWKPSLRTLTRRYNMHDELIAALEQVIEEVNRDGVKLRTVQHIKSLISKHKAQ